MLEAKIGAKGHDEQITKGQVAKSGSYRMVRNNFSKKGLVEADHQPAQSHMKTYAKDKGVRDISKEQLPTMSIPLDVHKETANYKGRATTTRPDSYGRFKSLQEKYLKEGDYKEAVWNAVKTNWIPYVRGLNDKELRREYKDAMADYFVQYSNLEWADKSRDESGNVKTVIRKDDARDLTRRLNSKLAKKHDY